MHDAIDPRAQAAGDQDEVLELLWIAGEGGGTTRAALEQDPLLAQRTASPVEAVRATIAAGLAHEIGDKLTLTDAGTERAREIIRRNRLTLRLFEDLLRLPHRHGHAQGPACALEHILSDEATGAICTLLGHPEIDPEGRPIPPGPCCASTARTVAPVVVRLSELGLGCDGRIVYMTPRFHAQYDRLSGLGIVPGTMVRLHQRSPSYVVQAGETTIALDKEIAQEISVVPQ